MIIVTTPFNRLCGNVREKYLEMCWFGPLLNRPKPAGKQLDRLHSFRHLYETARGTEAILGFTLNGGVKWKI
jgi:hypothetical protein